MARRWNRERLISRLLDDSGEAQLDLMRWSANTSSHEVANLLMEVLRDYAPPGKKQIVFQYLATFIMALLLFPLSICLAEGSHFPLWFVLPVVPYIFMLVKAHHGTQVAQRAALMLARMNDERAIPYLAECWRETPNEKKVNESITEELTRLATQAHRKGESATGAETLRDFIRHRFPLSSRRDLTDVEADMFLCVLRLLAQSEKPLDRKAIEQVARLSSIRPNHALIIEVAQQMLEPVATPAISLNAILPSDTTIQPEQQIQQNRHI